MTTIFLHGKIAKKYGKKFKFAVSRPKDAILALDTIFEDFSKELIDLAKKGFQYSLVVDNKPITGVEDFTSKSSIKEIHILPVICGSGAIGAIVGGIAIYALAAAASTAGYALLATVLTAVALAAISYGIQSLMAKPPDQNNPGASTATSAATSKSFMFTNKENVKQQGNPIPVGYGRLRIGSAVIQETVKSYPNSISTFDEFVSQTTQEGQSNMSIVNNQQ